MDRTPLDQFVAGGMEFLAQVSGEPFTFRNAPYTGQISGLGTQQDWMAGGNMLKRRCTIVFTPGAAFLQVPRNGERIVARGITMKISSVDQDGAAWQFECEEVSK